jgi:hypothetical protein
MSDDAATGPLAQRPSGLIVPAHLAHVRPEAPAPDTAARDADGRRRIVLAREDRKALQRIAGRMHGLDVATVFSCRTTREALRTVTDATSGALVSVVVQEPIASACGEVLLREGEDTDDPGFGCKCTRIHFLKG